MSLSALLERVEGATGETIDLFIAIACALDPVAYPGKWVEDEAAATWRFTVFEKFLGVGAWESAALALIGRVLPGAPILMGLHQTEETIPWARVGQAWQRSDATAASLALALCAALLAAMIGEEAKP